MMYPRRSEIMYDFHVKNVTETEPLRQYADHIVKQIKALYDWDADIQIHIESESKNKSLFLVSMSVFGLSDVIVVKKQGKNILAVLRKVRKAVLRQIHELNAKQIKNRKKSFLKQPLVA